jgi:hypothetical protein
VTSEAHLGHWVNMVSWRSWLRLAFAAVAVLAACSGSSDRKPGGGRVAAAGMGAAAGRGPAGGKGPTAGKGAIAGRGSSVGGSVGESGQAGEGVLVTGGTSGAGAGGTSAGRSTGGTAGAGIAAGMGNFAGTGVAGSGGPTIPPGWNCAAAAYGNGKCDCGCGARDSDCDSDDIDACESCNTTGSCDFRSCPGKIDPDNVTRCLAPPVDWTCSSFYYDDGNCDCGCGAVDLDCEDESVDSCEFCGAFGSCSGGDCPGPIDPENNAECKTPDGWTCPPNVYHDGHTCDCGCGILDPDCESASRNVCDRCSSGCSNEGCPGPIDAKDNTICTGVPSSWTCLARFFKDGQICNCGCGAHDPDCADDTIDSCDRCDFEGSCSARDCPGTIDRDNNAYCERPDPPTGWTCSWYQYGDGYSCDCGCGVPDIDCANDDDPALCTNCSACGSAACPGLVDPTDVGKCVPPPAEWECQLYYYGDGYYCDCGCGAPDPDCKGATKDQCTRCDAAGGSCSQYDCSGIQTNNNTLCTNSAPPEWTCPRRYYRDQACDCGCGARDPDCANGTLGVCKFCNDPGSCSTAATCAQSTIDPANNGKCLP